MKLVCKMKILLFIGILLGLGVLANAMQESENTNAEPLENMNKQQTASSGRSAFIDPETGELTSTPSPEQQEMLNSNSKKLAPESEVIEHPDGMIEVILNESMHSNLDVNVGCDGALKKSHSDDKNKALESHDCDEK